MEYQQKNPLKYYALPFFSFKSKVNFFIEKDTPFLFEVKYS